MTKTSELPGRAASGKDPGLPGKGAGSTDQERVADRLLRSTAARSYDPELDIDWSAPPEPGKIFLPEHRSTLYGTPLWDRLTPEQRRELGKHEAASVAGFGIWLECILMRLLAKLAYEENPATRHVQYALAEMAEECRHSTMFARLIEWMGVPYYGPPRHVHALGRLLTTTAHGPAMWGAILIGEEITDRYQREMAADDSIQPIVRMVNKIHILEEARHIGFARAELTRSAARLSLAELPMPAGDARPGRVHRGPEPDQPRGLPLRGPGPRPGAPRRAGEPRPPRDHPLRRGEDRGVPARSRE